MLCISELIIRLVFNASAMDTLSAVPVPNPAANQTLESGQYVAAATTQMPTIIMPRAYRQFRLSVSLRLLDWTVPASTSQLPMETGLKSFGVSERRCAEVM